MKTSEFLAHLRSLKIRVSAKDGDLKISAPKGVLTADLRGELAKRKAEILAVLDSGAVPVDPTQSVVESGVIERVPRDGSPLPLSFTQQRLWFLDQLETGLITYNMWIAWTFRGRLDVALLERCVREIVRRHDVLRTTFPSVDGVPTQEVDPEVKVRFEMIAGDGKPPTESEIRAILKDRLERPFDLEKGPLFRPSLVRVRDTEHILFVCVHHIVFDGVSRTILFRELSALYEAFVAGKPSPLPELPVQYADFAAWQRDYFQGPEFQSQREYWKKTLAGDLPVLELPTDRPRPAVQTYRGATKGRPISLDVIDTLGRIGQEEGATLYMVLLAAFKTFLHRLTSQEEIIVGTAMANRNRGEIEDLLGFFVNTLVLRTELGGEPSFRQVLHRVRDVFLGALEHQDMPFQLLVDELQPERDLSYTPLFQSLFVLDEDPGDPRHIADLELESFPLDNPTARTDLVLTAYRGRDVFYTWFEYGTDLFDPETIVRWLAQFETLLRGIVADPDAPISHLPLLGEDERHRLLEEWNDVASDFSEAPIHAQFEAQARRTPDAVAVGHPLAGGGYGQMTYGELDRRSNQLADHLIDRGVEPGSLVGLCLKRTPDTLVALLGILKAGAAYVPLDPGFPVERIAYMVSDAKLRFVVTTGDLLGSLPSADVETVRVDEEADAIAARPEGSPGIEVAVRDRMYVIYTSGSTGRPKGVEVEHRSVSNFLASMAREPGLSAEDTLLAVTTLSFDISVLELMLPLVVGARVVIAPSDVTGEGDRLLALLGDLKPSVMQATPATWRMLSLAGWEGDANLRIFCGGEALPRELADQLVTRGKEVWNLYGPTEATIWSTVKRIEGETELVTIGHPIESTRVYVLDRNMAPVPIGVSGELWIGGDGLARGYLDRPELTAERFVPDPFAAEPGARIYRTGDLARWLATGELECLGRVDHQVKVRGFRIELGEIEAVLTESPGVHACAAIVREDQPGDQRIVAYYVAGEEETASANELRFLAQEKLPGYMVPSSFVELEELPLTPNAKVDRRALAALEAVGPAVETAYVAPRDDTEAKIAAIWTEVLGVERVGVHDSFFDLGGNSLLTVQAMSRLRNALKVDLPLRDMFEDPTVAGLASRLAAAAPAIARPIRPVSRSEPLQLSFTQQRLWFLDQLEPGSTVYNMWAACTLRGPLDVEVFGRALDEIVRRHEVLRVRFVDDGGTPTQVVSEPDGVRLERLTRTEEDAALSEDEWRAEARRRLADWTQVPFELATGPLLRTMLVEIAEDEHAFCALAHHAVFDGWSVGVFFRELVALYEAFTAGRPSPLPDLSVQYADYAAWQRELLEGEEFERQLSYWRETLAGELPVLELPTDRPRPREQTYLGANESRQVSGDVIDRLAALAGEEGATLFMVLLAAYQAVLSRYSGQDDLIVGTAVANRNRAELEPLIGFFVNTLVVRTHLDGDPTFRELCGRVREAVLGAMDHQDVPFEKLVDELQPARNLSYTPIYQTLFVLDEDTGERRWMGDMNLEPLEIENRVSRTDLTMWGYRGRDGFTLLAEYNTDLFDPGTLARMLEHLEIFLAGAVESPDAPISELPLLGPDETEELLVTRNATRTAYPRESTIHQEFEKQAARTPDAVAAVFASIGGGESSPELTYGELNARANRVAHKLRALGVGPDDLVGLCTERSLDMLVGILGILKAGGAYLPLDPGYPSERLAFMLEDASVDVLLAQESLVDALPPFEGEVLCLDRDWDAAFASESDANPENASTISNLAYAMFTSGSTGRPKGVCVEHRSVLRLVSEPNFCELGPDEVMLHFAPISFDASTLEVWGALLKGGRMVVYPPSAPSLEELGGVIRDYGVTTAWLTAGLFSQMVDLRLEDLRGLRQLLAGGDVLPVPQVNRVLEELPDCRLVNGYGPTENTTFTCCHQISEGGRVEGSVPIGKPVSDTRVYVLDANLNPVPVGVPGELYIAGDGLARGYLNRPELTAERFVENPFEPGSRMYAVGDVVRWLPDGTIEFFGRRDNQVKVRGYRIELGEIESVLGERDGVRECAVIVREDQPGDRRIVAYVVPEADELPGAVLRGFMEERLPGYMVPAHFVSLDALPLSPNGKVDRRALPAPEVTRGDLQSEYVEPRDDVERRLAEIWQDVLGVERVGARDNFFELGGNSLLTTQVMSKVRAAFDTELPLRELFLEPTIAGLAGRIRPSDGNGVASRSYESEFESSLIPLQPNGWRTPLFLVSGAHAHEDDFLRFVGQLLPHLGQDQPIYGFKARGLDGVQEPHANAIEMARDYVREMREFQPEGPYLLAGNCVGGVVAYEMAQQLRREGHEVALVALLDTMRPMDEYRDFVDHHYRFWKVERFKNHWDRMRELPARERFGYVFGKTLKKLRMKVRLTERARKASHILRVEQQYSQILARYRAEPYPGDVTLITNEEMHEYMPDAGWGEVVEGNLDIKVVPGDHVTRLSVNGSQAAQFLRKSIDDSLVESSERRGRRSRGA